MTDAVRTQNPVARLLARPPAALLTPAAALILALCVLALGGALLMQFVGGVTPCKLCHIQRYPYIPAALLSLAALSAGYWPGLDARRAAHAGALLLLLAGVGLAISGGYGVYHVGVEQGWWPGPADCSGSAMPESFAALQALLAKGEQFVRCDEVPWSLFGLSLAAFNTMIAIPGAALAWAAALNHLWPRRAARPAAAPSEAGHV